MQSSMVCIVLFSCCHLSECLKHYRLIFIIFLNLAVIRHLMVLEDVLQLYRMSFHGEVQLIVAKVCHQSCFFCCFFFFLSFWKLAYSIRNYCHKTLVFCEQLVQSKASTHFPMNSLRNEQFKRGHGNHPNSICAVHQLTYKRELQHSSKEVKIKRN